MASSIGAIYLVGLRNAHALEAQADQLLSRQVERIQNYPAMRERLQRHIQETRQQSQRLERILEAHGTSQSTLKDLATSFLGNMAAMAHMPAQDEILKDSFANYAFEHYEIATYQALIEMAQQAGDQQGAALLQESLREEEAMAEWAERSLPDVVHTSIQRETQGQTSGI